MKILLDYIPTPQRNKRILFDQFHSLKYPENGYILRDSLLNSDYPYEWNGDHVFTNFVQLHQKITESGFYIEILTEPFSCFDSSNYKVLFILDPEDYMSQVEIEKVRYDFE
jgi:membrane-bound transcription factor site-1 protease